MATASATATEVNTRVEISLSIFYLSSLLASAGMTPLGTVSIAFWTCWLLTGFSIGVLVIAVFLVVLPALELVPL